MNYFQKRQIKKNTYEILRQAKHVRNTREDVISSIQLTELKDAISATENAVRAGDHAAMEKAGCNLYDITNKLIPNRAFPALRENFEILLVAVVIAMAFRTYFLQPFKIPTGSMQPTLYGIIYESTPAKKWTDQLPFKYIKWLITGKWYQETRSTASGIARYNLNINDPYSIYCWIGDTPQPVPKDQMPLPKSGSYVSQGDVIWRGYKVAGDHIFVDKVQWNFRHPVLGQIVVFKTDGIPIQGQVDAGTHYIKRLCGLPGNTISINPPYLLINGQIVDQPASIANVIDQRGYQLAPQSEAILRSSNDSISLKDHEYLALGDNTFSSKDSRYWGYVPESNLVGPAFIVYWPFSKRWGFCR